MRNYKGTHLSRCRLIGICTYRDAHLQRYRNCQVSLYLEIVLEKIICIRILGALFFEKWILIKCRLDLRYKLEDYLLQAISQMGQSAEGTHKLLDPVSKITLKV